MKQCNGGGWMELWRWIPVLKDESLRAGCSRTESGQCLSISKAGYPTTSEGNLCQCSTTTWEKDFLVMFKCNSPYFSLWPLPLLLGTTGKTLSVSYLITPIIRIYDLHLYDLSQSSLLQPKQSQSSLHFLTGEMMPSLNHPKGPWLESLQEVHISQVLSSSVRTQCSRCISPGLLGVEWSPPSICLQCSP